MLFVNPWWLFFKVRAELAKTLVLPAFGSLLWSLGYWRLFVACVIIWLWFVWQVMIDSGVNNHTHVIFARVNRQKQTDKQTT